jgi:hypothetical protein
MKRPLTASVLALFLVSSACAAEATSADDLALQDALSKTLAADGFHIEGDTTADSLDIHSEGDYVAPDRMVMEASDRTQSSITIIIGKNHYSSEPDTTERFSLLEMPCELGVEALIPALSLVLTAKDIRQTDEAFTFRGDDGTPFEGQAKVENGYLVELSVQYSLPHIQERVLERWTFSDFGTIVHIQPPRSEQLVQFENDPSVIVNSVSPVSCLS